MPRSDSRPGILSTALCRLCRTAGSPLSATSLAIFDMGCRESTRGPLKRLCRRIDVAGMGLLGLEGSFSSESQASFVWVQPEQLPLPLTLMWSLSSPPSCLFLPLIWLRLPVAAVAVSLPWLRPLSLRLLMCYNC